MTNPSAPKTITQPHPVHAEPFGVGLDPGLLSTLVLIVRKQCDHLERAALNHLNEPWGIDPQVVYECSRAIRQAVDNVIKWALTASPVLGDKGVREQCSEFKQSYYEPGGDE